MNKNIVVMLVLFCTINLGLNVYWYSQIVELNKQSQELSSQSQRISILESKLPEGYYPVLEIKKSHLSYGNTVFVQMENGEAKIGVKDKYAIVNLFKRFETSKELASILSSLNITRWNGQQKGEYLLIYHQLGTNEIGFVKIVDGIQQPLIEHEVTTIMTTVDIFFSEL